MSFLKSAKDNALKASKISAGLAQGALKLTGTALNQTAKLAAKHQPKIAAGTQRVLEASGKSIEVAGKSLTKSANHYSQMLANSDPQTDTKARQILNKTGSLTAGTLSLLGKATSTVGNITHKSSPAVGGATGSAITGLVSTVSGAFDSVAITEGQFRQLKARLDVASTTIKADADRKNAQILDAQRRGQKNDLLDMLVIGGVTLSSILRSPDQTPEEIEAAFALAYPGLAASGESFADAVARVPTENLIGLVSGTKGKLFEIELVEHLNSGGLPDGLHAEMVGSATQPGFDIQILNEHGAVIDVLQAKATQSAAYVQEALERYPTIDITTTSEVYADLVALGNADMVHNSGISEQLLESKIQAALESGNQLDAAEFLPSSIGMAIIAMSSFMDKDLTLEQKGIQFGDRAAKATVAGGAAHAALVVTNAWWAALAIGVGSRWLTTYGGNKRQRIAMLEEMVRNLEAKAGRRKLPNTIGKHAPRLT